MNFKKRPILSFTFALWTVAVLTTLAGPSPAGAATITDNAKLFSSTAVQEAQQTIDYIKVHHHKDLNVETFPAVPDSDRAGLDPAQPKAFFEKWAEQRAQATGTDGVYVMVCMDPHYVQVEVGNKTKTKEFTLSDRDQLSEKILGALKVQKFDLALTGTANFVKQRMHANTQGDEAGSGASSANSAPPAASNGPPAATPPVTPVGTGGMKWGGLICVGIAVLLLFALFRGVGRSNNPGQPTGGYPPAQGGYPPNYQGGYPQGGGYAPRSGGGFGTGLLGGLLGGALGSWGYDRMRGGGGGGGGWTGGGAEPGAGASGGGGGGSDFSTSSGTDTSFSDPGGGGSFDSGGGGGGGGGGDSGGGGSF